MNSYKIMLDFNGHGCELYEITRYLQGIDFKPLNENDILRFSDSSFNMDYDFMVEAINHDIPQVNLIAILEESK